MNVATPTRPRARQRPSAASAGRQMPQAQSAAAGQEPGAAAPVAPVAFVEPPTPEEEPSPVASHADRSDDNMDRLCSPFDTNAA